MFKRKNGFTVVELLIVIAVVGILATITIIAYNDMREKAVDAKRSAAIDQYAKIISVYKSQNRKFPEGTGCMGTLADYPAKGIFDEGVCFVESADTPSPRYIRVNETLNNELKTISSSIPDPAGSEIQFSNSAGARGMWYVNGDKSTSWLFYYDTVKGGLSCAKGSLVPDIEGDDMRYSYCSVTIE